MIDPTKVTDYNRTIPQLEEYLCFCICVAQNNAKSVSKGLEKFFRFAHDEAGIDDWQPFQAIRHFGDQQTLRWHLRDFGIGKHNKKSEGLLAIAQAGLDLREVPRAVLINYPSIGMKTASYFILHSRPNVRIACLDRHMCRWMKVEVPKSVNEYLDRELEFLSKADELNMSCAELDLYVWNSSQKN